MSFPTLPLKIAKPIEASRGFEGIRTLADLINAVAVHLGVDPNQLLQFQEITPGSVDPSKDVGPIFIKTVAPYYIAIRAGSEYQRFYQYPPNVPLLWTQGESNFPAWLTRLTESELTQYGLTNPDTAFYFMLKV